MTKLLMSCDDYVYHCEGVYYAASQEKADFYQRYLRVFDTLRLVTRCVEEKTLVPGRVKLDHRIEFVPVPLFQGPKQYAKTYFKIGKIIKNVACNCDAAVLRLPSTIAMRLYAEVKRAGIPYATEIVYDAYDGYESSKSLMHKVLWKIIDNQMRAICYRANGVSCVTEHYLQRRYYTKRQDGFVNHYSSLSLPQSFYGNARKFPDKQVLTISHVANQVEFNGRKGHVEVIRALANLKKQGIEVNVKFAGKDYFGGQVHLEELAESLGVAENVKFAGYLNREQLDSYLDATDLFVLPTRAEGLPRVIIEAMAKGLPCISTNVSGNPELLSAHWLIDYDDVEALTERIRELCSNAALYEATSAENFKNSCGYEASILQKRRDAFYTKLKTCVK